MISGYAIVTIIIIILLLLLFMNRLNFKDLLGTSRASMNRTGKTTASKGIDKTYNEHKEFHEREVEAHICAAFMEMSGMENMDCK